MIGDSAQTVLRCLSRREGLTFFVREGGDGRSHLPEVPEIEFWSESCAAASLCMTEAPSCQCSIKNLQPMVLINTSPTVRQGDAIPCPRRAQISFAQVECQASAETLSDTRERPSKPLVWPWQHGRPPERLSAHARSLRFLFSAGRVGRRLGHFILFNLPFLNGRLSSSPLGRQTRGGHQHRHQSPSHRQPSSQDSSLRPEEGEAVGSLLVLPSSMSVLPCPLRPRCDSRCMQ